MTGTTVSIVIVLAGLAAVAASAAHLVAKPGARQAAAIVGVVLGLLAVALHLFGVS